MRIYCPHCNQEYDISEEYYNKKIRCTVCNKKFIYSVEHSSTIGILEHSNESKLQQVTNEIFEESTTFKKNNIIKKTSSKISVFICFVGIIGIIVLIILICHVSNSSNLFKKDVYDDDCVEAIECHVSNSSNLFKKGTKQYEKNDYVNALYWFNKAADKGNADAMCCIGDMYYFGRGVSENEAEALKWYKKAADKGNVKAMTNIGFMYYEGRGVSEDRVEGLKWYKKAARLGEETAQKILKDFGEIY